MKSSTKLAAVLSTVFFATSFGAQAGECKPFKFVATMAHVACASSAAVFCLNGNVEGNFNLKGSAKFTGESLIPGPATGPDAQSNMAYSGVWDITTSTGTLRLREAGISNDASGTSTSGLVSAFNAVIGGTGDYQGGTGYFFVHGTFATEPSTFELSGQFCR